VNYVRAGGRNPTPPRKAIGFTQQTRNKPLSNMVTEVVLRRMKAGNATVHVSDPASAIGPEMKPVIRAS
jgi:hypothetical protein